MDVAEVMVNRYFDHYLTDVFPQQMELLLKTHNADEGAHKGTIRKIHRGGWMIAGVSAFIAAAGAVGAVVYYIVSILPHSH
jgi:hypothetical protein